MVKMASINAPHLVDTNLSAFLYILRNIGPQSRGTIPMWELNILHTTMMLQNRFRTGSGPEKELETGTERTQLRLAWLMGCALALYWCSYLEVGEDPDEEGAEP